MDKRPSKGLIYPEGSLEILYASMSSSDVLLLKFIEDMLLYRFCTDLLYTSRIPWHHKMKSPTLYNSKTSCGFHGEYL